MNEHETNELEKQQLLLMKLLNNFENCLDRIRTLLNAEQPLEINVYQDNDDEWVDVNREDKLLKKQRCVINLNNQNHEIKVDSQNNMV